MFAAAHPQDVAGVVLLDSSHPDESRRALAALPRDRPLTELRRGIKLPRVDHGVAIRRSYALARRVRSLGDLRLIVITAGQPPGATGIPPDVLRRLEATWLSLQEELSRLSTDSVHIIALRSDHFVQSFLTGQPDVVIRAVRAVVDADRADRPLPSCAHIFRRLAVRCRP
jgi:hypothetical protein